MNKQLRTPRPLGTTEIGLSLKKEPDNVELQSQLQQHIIRHYIQNNFTYCHKHMGIEELATYTSIPESLITEALLQTGQNTFDLIDSEEQSKALRVLLGLSLKSALGDSQRALKQLLLLQASQGNGYKAFITTEVNKALKLTQDSTTQMLNIYKALAGNSGPNIIINNNNSQALQNNFLTPDRALELISSKDETLPLLESAGQKDVLFEEYELELTPEVNAIRQTGLDTQKEGLNIRELAQISDALVNDLEGPKTHIDRRAIEVNWDLEDDEI